MNDETEFRKRRFRTAARHYLAGRTPYPDRLIHRVAEQCGLGPGDRVMDLGCGPGQLARAFAPHAASVLALDPEPEMLREARAASDRVANIEWRQAGSGDLAPEMGRFRLVAMGRSFHWMDRVETLRRLDAMLDANGTVALFHDRHPDVPDNAWREPYRAITERYAGDDGVRALRRRPGWTRHEAILLDSTFSELEEIAVIERHAITRDTLLDRALSMSSTSRARLGDRTDAMLADLRAALPGTITEMVASTALLARRPS